MKEKVKNTTIRLIEVMGHIVDREYFDDPDAWIFLTEIDRYRRADRQLPAGIITILAELAIDMGLKPGAKRESFLPTLEAQFGRCPLPSAQIESIIDYVRAEVNGGFDRGFIDKRKSVVFGEWAPLPPGPRPKNRGFL